MLLAIFIALASIAFGILISNFKVLILIPAIALAATIIPASGIARPEHLFAIALALVIAIVGLQLGYLIGIAILAFWPVGGFAAPSNWQQRRRRSDTDRRTEVRLAGREIR